MKLDKKGRKFLKVSLPGIHVDSNHLDSTKDNNMLISLNLEAHMSDYVLDLLRVKLRVKQKAEEHLEKRLDK